MSFNVTIQPSGRSFQVDRDEPILLAAIRQGKVESVTYKGARNDDIQMWVVYPSPTP